MRIKLYTAINPFYCFTAVFLLLFNAAGAQYCTTGLYSFGCTDDDYIQSFSTTGGVTNITNNNTGCSNTSANAYTYFSTMGHSAIQGTVVNFSVTNTPVWPEGYKIWVDYNNNNSFADPGELVYNPATTLAANGTATGNFTVPVTTPPGIKRLRVRCVFNTTTFADCNQFTFGEVEDYNFTVIAATPCSGMPTAGTASITSSCPTTISLAGFSLLGNIAFQWQKKPVCDSVWSDIPGATSYNLAIASLTTPTDYRAYVTCTNTSQSDTSNIVNIISASPCYCTSNSQFLVAQNIFNVTAGSLSNSSNCGTTGGVGSMQNQYSNYTGIVDAPVFIKGSSVPFGVSVGVCNFTTNNGTAIFIDYNQNGVFPSCVNPPGPSQ